MAATVYVAIGGIHGRLELLEPLYARLNNILESDYPTPVVKRILFGATLSTDGLVQKMCWIP